ncbi:MAG: hypothetical protein MJ204_10995 [Bacteroidales bacterium]|nr:hypothetical protein [Bacteroidales bacterium]
MTKNSRKTFIVCACIGFIMSLIKIVVNTSSANITTIQTALSNLEQLLPWESLNTITIFYLCIAIVPVLMAMCLGALGVVVRYGFLFFTKQINTKGEPV